MIENLTPEQEALLPVYRDKWLSIGLSTERANRAEAEDGVRLAYELQGLKAPERFIWAESPMGGIVAQAYLLAGLEQPENLLEAAENPHPDAKAHMSSWSSAVIDQGWSVYYSSWFDTMSMIGVTGTEQWAGLQKVAENAYWWWAFDDAAVLTERPTELHRDELNRLHSEDGMAIRFSDGWGFYSWHGTRVPEWVVLEPSVERAMKEPNTEIRRSALESLGWEAAIDQLVGEHGAELVGIAEDPGNAPNMLELYSLPDSIYEEDVNVLLVVNGSPDRDGSIRRYGETVPASITDPVEAAAWQYGVPTAVYRQLVRRT